MKTAKKTMAAVLALALTLTLFAGIPAFVFDSATAAGADNSNVGKFTDVTWANPYAEAIAVLAAARITTGTSDTTFGPKENVSRQQSAAFIARLALSYANAEKLLDTDTGFTDVASTNTFSKYIAWCVSENAINGVTSKTFDPRGDVTGVQFLKMLLGILNVDKVTKLTGTLWKSNTINYAIKLGLLEDMPDDLDYDAPATREEIAQYILNALVTRGYSNEGYGNSVTGWLEGGMAPLYITNGLSRRQTEDPSKPSDNPFLKVTKYGELYYRWETAKDGAGITAWKPDVKNERLMETVIANPNTTGGLPYGKLANVFKVFINGAVVNAVGPGNTSPYITGERDANRFITNEYTFNVSLASAAINMVCGTPDYSGNVTDETWTGATIKIYEQRLSNDGVYDPITGRYIGNTGAYPTREFDGKADKIIVTYEYLGDVVFKDTSGAITSYTVDLRDATHETTPFGGVGRSRNAQTTSIKTIYGDYAVNNILRVVPALPTIDLFGLPGAYVGWFDYWNTTATATPGTRYTASNSPDTNGAYWIRWDYCLYGSASALDYQIAEQKTIAPSSYGYAFLARGSTQTERDRLGMYISATQGGVATWISGTYQEILRANKDTLYVDNTRYTVYLDAQGYILGGFTHEGAEYVFLTRPKENEYNYTSTWYWLSTKDSEPRSILYYRKDAFKVYNAAADVSNSVTHNQRDVDNGVLNPARSNDSQYMQYAYSATVARVWNNHAKILTWREITGTTSYLPTDGKLYVEVTWNAIAGPNYAGDYVFTQRTVGDADTNFRRNTGAKVYKYYDDGNFLDNDKNKRTVYVIVYPDALSQGFALPNEGDGTITATPIATLTQGVNSNSAPAEAGEWTLTLSAPITGATNIAVYESRGAATDGSLQTPKPTMTLIDVGISSDFSYGGAFAGSMNRKVELGSYAFATPRQQLTVIANALITVGLNVDLTTFTGSEVVNEPSSVKIIGNAPDATYTAGWYNALSYDIRGQQPGQYGAPPTPVNVLTVRRTKDAKDAVVPVESNTYTISLPTELKAKQIVTVSVTTATADGGSPNYNFSIMLCARYNTLNAAGASSELAADIAAVMLTAPSRTTAPTTAEQNATALGTTNFVWVTYGTWGATSPVATDVVGSAQLTTGVSKIVVNYS